MENLNNIFVVMVGRYLGIQNESVLFEYIRNS